MRSRNDGDIHYISGHRLIQLYGVKYDECIIIREGDRIDPRWNNLITLRPDWSGDYKL